MTRTATAVARQTSSAELRRIVFRLRRAVRNRVRLDSGEAEMPGAQAEVLRLLQIESGMRVQDVAERLGIAANTASTLVGQLGTAGLVERVRDAEDARVARLYLTAAAKARIARAQDRGAAAIGQALEQLSADERERIAKATPALSRLLEVLEGPADRTD